MIRVVLDTNVYISAFLFGGKPLQVLDLVENRGIAMLYSQPIRSEVESVLAEKFGWPTEMIDLACSPYWKVGHAIKPRQKIRACSDPDDDRILECAFEAKADSIVSGDKHLLNMVSFSGISILRPDAFLKSLHL
ncbi:MAG TPA: putative toxin-antitoxin system toxin component, PIN family [Acidobacteriaceae bacterium]|nr:putative toxin-antitoxin system toxin component, PIN family [Acidobacteriaceae bacterium]